MLGLPHTALHFPKLLEEVGDVVCSFLFIAHLTNGGKRQKTRSFMADSNLHCIDHYDQLGWHTLSHNNK